jgi:hypothetical protein
MSQYLNPELLEALRSHPGTAANPTLQALLSRLDPSSAGGSLPSTEELLGQLESSDPTLALVAKYLANRPVPEVADTVEEETGAEAEAGEVRTALDQTQRLAQVVQNLQSQVVDLRVELEQLRERNDLLAAALGACYLCWGEDRDCPICQGTGRPGSMPPEGSLFTQYVGPALRMLQSQKEVSQRPYYKDVFNLTRQDLDSQKGEQS